jgi:transcriptional regulator with XRE-family HTH domain
MQTRHVGERLRRWRRQRNLTLDEVASRAGCSPSMVSKIETRKAEASLTLLRRLAAALDVNVAAVFEAAETNRIVMKPAQRPRLSGDALRSGDGIVLERLVPYGADARLQANIHIVAPGGASDGLITHVGEEMGYLLEGTIDLTVDGEVYRLEAGDSFHFSSERPHGYNNPGTEHARILWINTPPTF